MGEQRLKYKAEVSKYQKKDTMIAFFYWILLMAVYFVAGIIIKLFGTPFEYVMIPTNIILTAACIVVALTKREGLSSLGFRKAKLWPSLGVGLSFGILGIICFALPAIIWDWKFMSIGEVIYQLFYQLVVIALVEEIIFRGYIQTRLYGLFKNDISAILVGTLLFALMHFPFQVAIYGIEAYSLNIVVTKLVTTSVAHIAFNLIFRRYYSIYGVVLFHALWNWGFDLFVKENSIPAYISYGICALILVILGIKSLYLHRPKLH